MVSLSVSSKNMEIHLLISLNKTFGRTGPFGKNNVYYCDFWYDPETKCQKLHWKGYEFLSM